MCWLVVVFGDTHVLFKRESQKGGQSIKRGERPIITETELKTSGFFKG